MPASMFEAAVRKMPFQPLALIVGMKLFARRVISPPPVAMPFERMLLSNVRAPPMVRPLAQAAQALASRNA